MSNDRLRAALRDAGLEPDDLARAIDVDVKTVRRWLSGKTPYPRHRLTVAHALNTTEQALWPDAVVTAPAARRSDLVTAYPTGEDRAAPDWQRLVREATDQIGLLDDTLEHVLSADDVGALLADKAASGCRVRVMIGNPGSPWTALPDVAGRTDIRALDAEQRRSLANETEAEERRGDEANNRAFDLLAPLDALAGIEARMYNAARYATILRADEQMLVTLHLWGRSTMDAPLLHLRRQSKGGLFDRYAEHFEAIWRHTTQPIEPLTPSKAVLGMTARTSAGHVDRASTDERRSQVGSTDAAPPQRRWPGRDL